MGDTGTTIIFVLVIIGMLGFTVLLQGWRMNRSPLGKVLGIFKDLKYNGRLIEKHNSTDVAGRFKTDTWDKHRKAIGFLPEELLSELEKIFGEIGEANANIDQAAKLGSRTYSGTYDAGRFQTHLADTTEKLREWIQANMYNRDLHPKKLGFFRWR